MAITYRTSVAGGNATNTNATATITPALNDLFVVFVAETAGDNTMTVTDDNGGTYTKVNSSANGAGTAHGAVFIRNQLLNNATSTIVTLVKSVSPTSTGHELVVIACAGSPTAGAAAKRQGATINGASGVATTTFGSAALTVNMTLVGLVDLTNPPGLTAPTSFTNRQNVGQATPFGLIVATRDSGFTGTAITWGTNPGTSFASIAIELTFAIQDGYVYSPVDFAGQDTFVSLPGFVYSPLDFAGQEFFQSGHRGDAQAAAPNYFYPAHNGGWTYNFIAGSLPPPSSRPEMLEVTQNVAVKVPIKMRSSVTGLPIAGLTLVIKLRKAGQTLFTTITPAYVDATNGSYELALLAAHVDTSGCAELLITAAGALPNTDMILNVIAINKNDAVRMGLSALPNAAAGAIGGLPALDANLNINAAVQRWLTAVPLALSTNGYVQTMLRRWLTDDAGGTPLALQTGLVQSTANAIDGAVVTSIVNGVLDSVRSTHVTPGTVGEGIAIAAAMLQGNFFMDSTDNTSVNGQTAARVRCFHDGVTTAAATDGGIGEGEFATFLVTTTYSGPNKITTHRVVQQ